LNKSLRRKILEYLDSINRCLKFSYRRKAVMKVTKHILHIKCMRVVHRPAHSTVPNIVWKSRCWESKGKDRKPIYRCAMNKKTMNEKNETILPSFLFFCFSFLFFHVFHFYSFSHFLNMRSKFKCM